MGNEAQQNPGQQNQGHPSWHKGSGGNRRDGGRDGRRQERKEVTTKINDTIIRMSEIPLHVPAISFSVGRNDKEGRFVPWIRFEQIDEVIDCLQKAKAEHGPRIAKAKEERAERDEENRARDAQRDKEVSKSMQHIGRRQVDTPDMTQAQKRSEKQKLENQKTLAMMGYAPAVQEEPVAVTQSTAAVIESAAEPADSMAVETPVAVATIEAATIPAEVVTAPAVQESTTSVQE